MLLKKASVVKDKKVSGLVKELNEVLAVIAAETEFSENSVNTSIERADGIVDQLSVLLR